ncbi:MarR family transcriptional regulator [Actinorhabdospora filicis]|uniref:MarR family transcriptional regulator n=1 Tax=Actinorhabdospora filicis TaxID=1785913 RepID=A0A9W6SRS7_9ACTN|nr:MarR family transcriptional regulator [Actinorhabdospora filicis]GLZ81196.1 MarR family transcriptional regulator [Actinorhabdospora filicis]
MTDDTPRAKGFRDDHLWRRVTALHARVEQKLSTALQRGHGLGLSEYRALGDLAANPKSELRMQELADGLGLNQSSVTRLAGRLETAGLTVRDLCADDRRGVYAVLTEAGRKRYEDARGTYESVLGEALDAEDAGLVKALRAVG